MSKRGRRLHGRGRVRHKPWQHLPTGAPKSEGTPKPRPKTPRKGKVTLSGRLVSAIDRELAKPIPNWMRFLR